MKSLVILCLLVVGTRAGTYYTGHHGHSGIVKDDGNNVQFTAEEARNIISVGPSGVVMRDGNNKQRIVKRHSGYVNNIGSIGYSGIVKTDGTIKAFSPEFIKRIVSFGPSGIVTDDGKNIQLDELLNFRSKRAILKGPSGMILEDGTPVQFSRAGVEVLLEGPSGYVMTDGTLVQKRAKRASTDYGHNVGDGGIVTSTGKQYQLAHGVTVVSAGPSGAVLSDGNNIQY